MKGVIALLFLLSVAFSLKAHSANHEAAFTTWVNPNAWDYTCGCKYYFVWPRTMTDCPNCGGIPVSAALSGGVSTCNSTPEYQDTACCWPTSQTDAVLKKWGG
jgi:hypothetical protein